MWRRKAEGYFKVGLFVKSESGGVLQSGSACGMMKRAVEEMRVLVVGVWGGGSRVWGGLGGLSGLGGLDFFEFFVKRFEELCEEVGFVA